MEFINHNGKLQGGKKAVINAANRGLRYGDGLFETFKSVDQELLFAPDHFERLWEGLGKLQFVLPGLFSAERLQQEILQLLGKNKHTALARVRLMIVRGDGGLYDEINHHPEYLIETWALPATAGQWNSNGLVLGVHQDARKTRDAFSHIKHNNFLPYVMAALEAKKNKWNDAIVLNDAGRICDSSIANVFTIKAGKISTPSLAEGCIAGVVRKQVLKALADHNIPVQESAITVDELLDADEVFVTNSILNLRWVQSIGNKQYSINTTRQIYSDFLSTILR